MKDYLLINLSYVRKRIGVTQTELAKDLNTSQSQVGKYEKGNPKPPIEYILAFCERFGISPNDLLLKDLRREPYIIEVDLSEQQNAEKSMATAVKVPGLDSYSTSQIMNFIVKNLDRFKEDPVYKLFVESEINEWRIQELKKERERLLEHKNKKEESN
ncbi:helix-turn-helix domain-containing protein [Sungkyunkwania multivorans]|uniref:Helix-turn-helix domain-containing protein n=1 Tax=Sungkyunkwania multivorans TaxID=1173618 RepID=A0ABW3CY95_9FLAO